MRNTLLVHVGPFELFGFNIEITEILGTWITLLGALLRHRHRRNHTGGSNLLHKWNVRLSGNEVGKGAQESITGTLENQTHFIFC